MIVISNCATLKVGVAQTPLARVTRSKNYSGGMAILGFFAVSSRWAGGQPEVVPVRGL